jgi:hypothetical protein
LESGPDRAKVKKEAPVRSLIKTPKDRKHSAGKTILYGVFVAALMVAVFLVIAGPAFGDASQGYQLTFLDRDGNAAYPIVTTVDDESLASRTSASHLAEIQVTLDGAVVPLWGEDDYLLFLSGPDAGCFDVSGGQLWLNLNIDPTPRVLHVTVNYDNPATVDRPDVSADYTLTITPKNLEWSGVLQPVNADGSSIFKARSTVPVKFRLTGASAGVTDLAARLYYKYLSPKITGDETEAISTSAATAGNLFRYSSGQYIFNWGTKGLASGSYQLRIDLGDGVDHTVMVGLK